VERLRRRLADSDVENSAMSRENARILHGSKQFADLVHLNGSNRALVLLERAQQPEKLAWDLAILHDRMGIAGAILQDMDEQKDAKQRSADEYVRNMMARAGREVEAVLGADKLPAAGRNHLDLAFQLIRGYPQYFGDVIGDISSFERVNFLANFFETMMGGASSEVHHEVMAVISFFSSKAVVA
jgi:hypothetical protein